MDLNADVGEGFGRWHLGDDEAILPVVTSANVACGFHAGDPSLLRRTCELAVRHGVAVGAQVSYPDLVGFGRRFLDIEPYDLVNAVLYQIGALDALARAAGTRVAYVKPHGALYNATVGHEAQAAAVVQAVASFGSPPAVSALNRQDLPSRDAPTRDRPARHPQSSLPVLGLPGSSLLRQAAEAGLPTVSEFFADRAYLPDGTLVPRTSPDAVLTDAAVVRERCRRLVREREVLAVDGSVLAIDAGSICVHGDTPGAAALAIAVRAAVEDAGEPVCAFVPLP